MKWDESGIQAMSKSFSSSSSSTIHHQKEKKGHDLLVVVIGFMATKLVQPPVPASHVAPPIPRLTKMMRAHRPVTATHSGSRRRSIFGEFPSGSRPFYAIRVAGQSPGLVGDDQDIVVKEEEEEEEEDEQEGASSDDRTIANVKADLYQAVQGINRGVFGVPSAKKSEIEALVKLLESQNPTPEPILNLDKVNGWWKLVYSTITILGSKRTKLGLRNFITLGDFLQIIDVEEAKAVNVIKFNARGFNFLNGELKIEASFKIASKSRVDIKYDSSTITPDKLMNVFKQNYDLLLGIFNPEGWLEITYLDESMRIGRDDKGNLFILERSEAT